MNKFDFVEKIINACYDIGHRNDLDPFEFLNKEEIKKPAIKENKMSELNLLTKVISAITYLYRKDGMAPNVIVSALPNKKIYLSINRYNDLTDRYKKNIVFRSTKGTVEEVLMDAVKWLVNQKKDSKNPIDELKDLVNDQINDQNNQININDF